MRVFITIFLLCAVSFVHSQVTITGSTGADGPYSTLKKAFDKINSKANQTGNDIIITITSSTNETSTASLTGQSMSWNSLIIYPTLSGLSISGNLFGPLISLNGTKNVCIDGRVNAVGSTKDLIINNVNYSNTSGTSTIRFVDGASYNSVQYCTIKGAGNSLASGVIFFSTSSTKNGNGNNTIDNNNITCSTNTTRPINAIYSVGTASKVNENIIISNNNIYDFLNPTTSSNGILLALNTNKCTITNNSFYERTIFNPTKAADYSIIKIDNPYGSGFIITDNHLGGQGELCGGNAWTKQATSNNIFDAIYLNTKAENANSVQNNSIQNVEWGNAGNATWSGINIVAGVANVGNEIGNNIGSPSNGAIQVTGDSNVQIFYGIQLSSASTVNCQNNVIESVMLCNTPFSACHFYGIFKSAGTGTTIISNNRIGSTSFANSIISTSTSINEEQLVYGIYSAGTGLITINNNTIANLTNLTANTNSKTLGLINGITTIAGKNSITNNRICHLTIANANDTISHIASVSGIVHSTKAMNGIVTGNTIHDLSNTYASFIGNVYGVYFSDNAVNSILSDNVVYNLSASATTAANLTGIFYTTSMSQSIMSGNSIYNLSLPNAAADAAFSITGVLFSGGSILLNTITKNFIHSFSTNEISSEGIFYGLNIAAGNSVFSNNIIALGGNFNTTIYGICDAGAALQTCNLFHNTIYLSGIRNKGSNHTYALYSASASNVRDYKNNIFFNACTNDGGTGKYFAVYLAYSINISLSIDNNDYYAAGSGGVLGYHAIGAYSILNDITTLSEWKTKTDQDENSKNSLPNYVHGGGSNPSDYQLVDTCLFASIGTGVLSDFGDNPRLSCPIMGAWEYVCNCWKGTLNTDWNIADNWTQKVVLSPGADLIFDKHALHDCFLDQNRSVYGVINASASFLNINQHTLLVHGDIYQAESGKINASSPNSTIVYAGASPQIIEAGQFVNNEISILTIDNSAGVTLTTNLEVDRLCVNEFASITIPEQIGLTVTGMTANYAGTSGILISSSAKGTGSFNHTTDDVSASVSRYIGSADQWKFIASPIAAQPISGSWTPLGSSGNCIDYDLYVYDEANSCWIYQQNSTISPTWSEIHPQSHFVPGKGYLYALHTAHQTNTFKGKLNNGTVMLPLTVNASAVINRGFNLVGNPYPSSIDWSTNVGYNRSMLERSGDGYDMWIWNSSVNNYGVYNSASGNELGTNGVSRHIAPMQAFFVRAKSNDNLVFNNASRTNLGADNWLHAPAVHRKKHLILRLSSEGNGSDEIKIDFGNAVNNAGALKLFSPVATAPSLYMPYERTLYSVRHLTGTIDNQSVGIGFKPGFPGEFTLQCLPDCSVVDQVYLYDKATQFLHSFTESSIYKFNSNKNVMSDRFEIYFSQPNSLIDFLKPRVHIVENQLMIDLSALNGDYMMRLHDIAGRILKTMSVKGGEELSILLSNRGVYLVTLVSFPNKRFDFKLVY